MEFYTILDRASSALLMGLTCCVVLSANTSIDSSPLNVSNVAYYTTANEYSSMSTILTEYKMTDEKFKVEIEAQELFGKMRGATIAEQRYIQANIDRISVPTGFNFWD